MLGSAVVEFVDEAYGLGRCQDGTAAAGRIVETEVAEAGLEAEGSFLIQLPVDGLGEAEGESRSHREAVPVREADDTARQGEARAAEGSVSPANEIGASVGFL